MLGHIIDTLKNTETFKLILLAIWEAEIGAMMV
jgi:hypothetical protein